MGDLIIEAPYARVERTGRDKDSASCIRLYKSGPDAVTLQTRVKKLKVTEYSTVDLDHNTAKQIVKALQKHFPGI